MFKFQGAKIFFLLLKKISGICFYINVGYNSPLRKLLEIYCESLQHWTMFEPFIISLPLITNKILWDFLASPVVKTLPYNAEGAGLIPDWEVKIPQASPACLMAKKPKTTS